MIDRSLFQLLGENKKYIILTVISMSIGLLANVSLSACICYMISLVIKDAQSHAYMIPILFALVFVLLRYICTIITGDLKDQLGRTVKKDLRKKIYDKIVRLGVSQSDDMSMAGLTQVALEGVEQLDLYYSSYIPQFFYSMIAPIILFFLCVGIDFRFAIVLLCCVPLIPISIIAVSKYAKKIFAKYWSKYTSMGDKFLDNVQGLKELKIYQADASAQIKMNQNAEEFRKITMKVLVMQLASTTIMDLVAYGGAGVGVACALYSALHSLEIPYALFLILIAVEFFLPLRAFGSAFHIAMNGASAGRKIISLLETPEIKWGTHKVDDTNIELNHVSFSYDQKRKVLDDVTLSFPSKGMSAIVGESGSGKTTIAQLIVGAIRTNAGQIKIGSYDIDMLDRDSYYSKLAYVSYNTYIFNKSVRDNFLLANKNIKDEEIFEALKSVNLYNFINEQGGLDKIIKEDASNLSGGQKQRLALAINLVANKDIYIFDEATSNIDIESEAIIMENIKKLSHKKNVIVISHRLENVVCANMIYFIKDGLVKEKGTHDELIKANRDYAYLYHAQKKLEEGYREVKE